MSYTPHLLHRILIDFQHQNPTPSRDILQRFLQEARDGRSDIHERTRTYLLVRPPSDKSDHKKGWAVLVVVGPFTVGEFYIPCLRFRMSYTDGTMIMVRGWMHSVMESVSPLPTSLTAVFGKNSVLSLFRCLWSNTACIMFNLCSSCFVSWNEGLHPK